MPGPGSGGSSPRASGGFREVVPPGQHGQIEPSAERRDADDAAGHHVHHQAAARGHVRHGGFDPLAGVRGRHGGAGAGRQCVRRRGGGRPGAAGGRAAHVRASGRGAGDRLRRPRRRGICAERTGPRARCRHHRGVRGPRPGPGSRERAPGRLRAGRVRHLDAVARRARQPPAARGHAACHRLRQGRLPGGARYQCRRRVGGRRVHRALAQLGRGLPARGRASPGLSFCKSCPGRHLPADSRRGGGGRKRQGGPDRSGQEGLLRRVRGRGDRQLPGARAGDGRHRRAARRPADRRRPGRLAGQHGAAGQRRLRRADRVQDRPLGAGPGVPAAVAVARRARAWRDGTRRRGPHPHRRGVREAGVRRPGGLVRRPGFRRGAAGGPAVAAVRGAAPRPGGPGRIR